MHNPQHRYAAGTRLCLSRWATQEALPDEYYIVREGKLAEAYT